MKEIPLTQGKITIVDDEDYERLAKHKWFADEDHGGRAWRAMRHERNACIQMGREILGAPDGMYVDHINGDPLDNRRSNLRLCTPMENSRSRRKNLRSSSQYKGVHWNTERRRWIAQIKINYRKVKLGRYERELDAARAYDRAALEHFGAFAVINGIED